jgi:hypothetical protein
MKKSKVVVFVKDAKDLLLLELLAKEFLPEVVDGLNELMPESMTVETLTAHVDGGFPASMRVTQEGVVGVVSEEPTHSVSEFEDLIEELKFLAEPPKIELGSLGEIAFDAYGSAYLDTGERIPFADIQELWETAKEAAGE